MRSRIRLVTQEGDCLYDIEDKLAKQAMTNRADLKETVGLYTRVRQSRADLSDAAMQNLVDKWSKSLIISASSAREAASSTQQFSHTLERRPCRRSIVQRHRKRQNSSKSLFAGIGRGPVSRCSETD